MKNGDELSLKELQMVDGRKQWTPEEYEEYRQQFKVTVNPIPYTQCLRLNIDEKSLIPFGNVLLEYDFSFQRCGYLIGQAKDAERKKDKEGSEEEKKAKYFEVTSYACYEPPQEGDDKVSNEWEDDLGKKVDDISGHLGMKRVGYVFSHTRIGDKLLTNEEVLKIATLQNKYGPHFVTVVATPTKEKTICFESYQASPLCCDLVKKGVLLIDKKNPHNMKTKKPVIFKGTQKENEDIELTFLFQAVPISFIKENLLRVGFPPKKQTFIY